MQLKSPSLKARLEGEHTNYTLSSIESTKGNCLVTPTDVFIHRLTQETDQETVACHWQLFMAMM